MSHIILIHIKESFKENKLYNHIRYANIETALDEINDPNTCSLEVLHEDMRRMYLDVENVPSEDHERIIQDIIRIFSMMVNIDASTAVYSINTNSKRHKGISYHVVWPYAIHRDDMRKLVIHFGSIHKEYIEYVDDCVYGRDRLFRLPNQGRPSQGRTGDPGLDIDDKHNIVKGEFNDFFIQCIDGLPRVEVSEDIKSTIVPKKFRVGHSGPFNYKHQDNMRELMEKVVANQEILVQIVAKMLDK